MRLIILQICDVLGHHRTDDYPPLVSISVQSLPPDKADERQADIIGQSYSQTGGHRYRNEYGDVSLGHLEHYLRGYPPAAEYYIVIYYYILHKALAKDSINGIMSADIFNED